ncbi:hypothetical protein QOT17_017331, partial [Balamuthia mandrillaris]
GGQKRCEACEEYFGRFNRKHYCRCCGNVHCASCTNRKVVLPGYGYYQRARICKSCAELHEVVRYEVDFSYLLPSLSDKQREDSCPSPPAPSGSSSSTSSSSIPTELPSKKKKKKGGRESPHRFPFPSPSTNPTLLNDLNLAIKAFNLAIVRRKQLQELQRKVVVLGSAEQSPQTKKKPLGRSKTRSYRMLPGNLMKSKSMDVCPTDSRLTAIRSNIADNHSPSSSTSSSSTSPSFSSSSSSSSSPSAGKKIEKESKSPSGNDDREVRKLAEGTEAASPLSHDDSVYRSNSSRTLRDNPFDAEVQHPPLAEIHRGILRQESPLSSSLLGEEEEVKVVLKRMKLENWESFNRCMRELYVYSHIYNPESRTLQESSFTDAPPPPIASEEKEQSSSRRERDEEQEARTQEQRAVHIVRRRARSQENLIFDTLTEEERKKMDEQERRRFPELEGVCIYSEREVVLVFRYMRLGSLRNCLMQSKAPIPAANKYNIAQDAARALNSLHSYYGFIHTNISPENVLISNDWNCRLGGLGNAVREEAHPFVERSSPRSRFYMAPEVMLQQRYSKKSDIYALGMLMLELFTGQPPYSQPHFRWVRNLLLRQLGERIMEGLKPEYEPNTPLAKLITRCIDPNPEVRPSADIVVTELETLYHVESAVTLLNSLVLKNEDDAPQAPYPGADQGTELNENEPPALKQAESVEVTKQAMMGEDDSPIGEKEHQEENKGEEEEEDEERLKREKQKEETKRKVEAIRAKMKVKELMQKEKEYEDNLFRVMNEEGPLSDVSEENSDDDSEDESQILIISENNEAMLMNRTDIYNRKSFLIANPMSQ